MVNGRHYNNNSLHLTSIVTVERAIYLSLLRASQEYLPLSSSTTFAITRSLVFLFNCVLMCALSFIGSPSFFQVIFTVASLTLQANVSSSSVASINCEFGVI